MFVLVLGHRKGLAKALNGLEIPFGVWNHKEIFNAKGSQFKVEAPYPQNKTEFLSKIPKNYPQKITHVIAGSEESVLIANHIRSWLNLETQDHRMLLRTIDKSFAKNFCFQKKLPLTPFKSPGHFNSCTFEELSQTLGLPFLAKLRRSSGGRGQVRINAKADFVGKDWSQYLFEKIYIGTEGSVESFVENGKILFSSLTSYARLGKENHIPGHFSEDSSINQKIIQDALALNTQVIKEIGIQKGMTHLEFILTKEGIILGEMAHRPPGGYIMDTLNLVYNLNFWEFWARLECGLSTKDFSPEMPNCCASIILHPGAGTVNNIGNAKNILRVIPELKKFKIKIQHGDLIEKRVGTGNDIGHALFKSNNRQGLLRAIERFNNEFELSITK